MLSRLSIVSICTRWLQALALDALAAWLEEDAGRLQPRLATRDTLARLTALLASHTPAGAPPLSAPIRVVPQSDEIPCMLQLQTDTRLQKSPCL